MSSKKNVGGMWVSVAAPFKFVKRPSAFNRCVGSKLYGQKGGNQREKFAKAASDCKGTRSKK
jgi:hypothetical protein